MLRRRDGLGEEDAGDNPFLTPAGAGPAEPDLHGGDGAGAAADGGAGGASRAPARLRSLCVLSDAFVGAASKERRVFTSAEKKWLLTQFAEVCAAGGEREDARAAFARQFPTSALLPLDWPTLKRWMDSEVEKTMKKWLGEQVAARGLVSPAMLTSELQTALLSSSAVLHSQQSHLPHLTDAWLQKLWKQKPLKGEVDAALQPKKAGRGSKRKAADALDEPGAAAGAAGPARKKLPPSVEAFVTASIAEGHMVMAQGKDAARAYFAAFLRQQVPPLEVNLLEEVVHKWFERQRQKQIRNARQRLSAPPPAGDAPADADEMDAADEEGEEEPAPADDDVSPAAAAAAAAAVSAAAAEQAAARAREAAAEQARAREAARAAASAAAAAATTAAAERAAGERAAREAAPAEPEPEAGAAAGAAATTAADVPPCCTARHGLFFTYGEKQVLLCLEMLEDEVLWPNFLHQYQAAWKLCSPGKALSKEKLLAILGVLCDAKVVICTTDRGGATTYKRATASDVSRAEAAAAKAAAAAAKAAEREAEDERRVSALRGDLASAEQRHAQLEADLAKTAAYIAVQEAAKAVTSASARGAAGKAVDALLEMLTHSGTSNTYQQLRRNLPAKRTDSLAIAHQNMAACYGMNGGPESFEKKLVNVLTIACFFKIDVMVCSEVPCAEARARLDRLRMPEGSGPLCGSKLPPSADRLSPEKQPSEEQQLHARLRLMLEEGVWDFRVSDPISPLESKKDECIMWLWRTARVRIDGQPEVLTEAEASRCSWPPRSRRPARCTFAPAVSGPHDWQLTLWGLHLAPKKLHAREDVAALGRYAAGLEQGVKERTLFVGDFNLAPVGERGMNPDPESAFEGLAAAGFHAANFEPTNLCALGRSGGRVYDNVLAHESCTCEEGGGVFSLHAVRPVEGRPGQRAYVFPMDDLLLKLAARSPQLRYPRPWLLEGLVGAAAAAPKPPPAAEGEEEEEESDDEEEAVEGGAAAAAAGGAVKTRTAANGLCSLGLFDHRFLFVELVPEVPLQ